MKQAKQWLALAAAAALTLGLLTGCDWFGSEQSSESAPPSSSQGQDNNATPPTQPSLDNVTAVVDNREYTVGDSFDPASLTVTLHFDDGTETEINGNQLAGLSWAPETFEDKDIGENTTVTLTYESLTATVTVKVNPGPASPGYESPGNYSIDEDGNYTVQSAVGLEAWAEAVRGGKTAINCTLTSDIDLSDQSWTAVGYYPTEYAGTFDGQGHSITGLQVTTNDPGGASAALFHTIAAGGTVKNLQLKSVNLKVEFNGVAGGIAANNYGSIIACSVTGDISAANGAAGGIAAFNSGSITGCWFSGTVQGNQNNGSGGIVCYNYGTVNACYWGATSDVLPSKTSGTQVDGQTVTWQSAVIQMNTVLSSSGHQWSLGSDGLPTLTSSASGSSLLRGLDELAGLFS